jgi:hypothetical protein
MPSLLRFLFVLGVIGGIVFGGLFFLAHVFEPEQREVTQPLPNVKVKR